MQAIKKPSQMVSPQGFLIITICLFDYCPGILKNTYGSLGEYHCSFALCCQWPLSNFTQFRHHLPLVHRF